MTVSPARPLSSLAALLLAPVIWQGAAFAQTQPRGEVKELPSVTIGPAPVIKRPSIVKGPGAVAPPRRRSGNQPGSLELRLDPKTGRALTREQMEERARRKARRTSGVAYGRGVDAALDGIAAALENCLDLDRLLEIAHGQ